MSLSARIAIGPSLRVALLATVVATGGFVVAGVTAAACWPAGMVIVVAATVAGWVLAIAAILEKHERTVRIVLSVSDRAEIGVDRYEQSWRLVEPTMTGPGFSILALAESGSSPRPVLLCYPLFGADIAPSHRRALSRFLLWSLRGGGTSRHP